MRGKSGLLENSVFWRRGARNPCRLQGWRRWLRGRTLGLKQWVRKPGTFCSLSRLQWQAAQHVGRPCLAQHFLIIPSRWGPASPGSHGSRQLTGLQLLLISTFTAGLHVCSPMRRSLFEDRVSFHFAPHPLTTKFLSHDKAGQHTSFRPKYPKHLLSSADRTLGKARMA